MNWIIDLLLAEGADSVKEKPESTLESLPGTDNLDQEKLQKEVGIVYAHWLESRVTMNRVLLIFS